MITFGVRCIQTNKWRIEKGAKAMKLFCLLILTAWCSQLRAEPVPIEIASGVDTGNIYAASLDAYQQENHNSKLVGLWKNTSPYSRGISKVIIMRSKNALILHTFGHCKPVECDWGISELSNHEFYEQEYGFDSDKKESINQDQYVQNDLFNDIFIDGDPLDESAEGRYESEFKNTRLFLELVDGGSLHIFNETTFYRYPYHDLTQSYEMERVDSF